MTGGVVLLIGSSIIYVLFLRRGQWDGDTKNHKLKAGIFKISFNLFIYLFFLNKKERSNFTFFKINESGGMFWRKLAGGKQTGRETLCRFLFQLKPNQSISLINSSSLDEANQ